MDLPRKLFAAVIAMIALAVAGGAVAATAEARIKRCNGQRVLCKQPFNEIVLAGAHNAMSADALDWVLPNQSIAIPDQLDFGIRALLIDTYYGELRDDGIVVNADPSNPAARTYLCHVYCQLGASRLAPELRQIRRFLRNRPNNVLLIENEDYISPAAFARALRRSGLVDFAYEGPTDEWPTARWMIRNRQQVVLLADNDAGDYPWYHRTYQGILQETPYNFLTPDLLTDPASWKASCGPNRGDVTGSMFLMNHWSPPTAPAEPDLEASAAVNARSVIVGRAEECARVRGRLPSIIAADQVTAGNLRGAVRDLNGIAAQTAGP
ncbi:MAG TPA: hypothetical protein VFH44_02670 [Solirubrobacterales bacterium]|nr:hypothetical protein [Solirubrobacterales bacterium]